MTYAARVQSLHKEYFLKGETVRALRGVTFDIPEGDYVAIMGPSGSGKSTLLNVLGCLDRPTRGSLPLGESDVSRMDDNALSTMRASNIGFVFQSYNLIQQLTVLENIEVPLAYCRRLNAAGRRRCRHPRRRHDRGRGQGADPGAGVRHVPQLLPRVRPDRRDDRDRRHRGQRICPDL